MMPKVTSPFKLYFRRVQNKGRKTPELGPLDATLQAARSDSSTRMNASDTDVPSPTGIILLRTKSLVRRTKSMVRRTRGLVQQKLSVPISSQGPLEKEIGKRCASPPTAYSSNNSAKDSQTFNPGPKILKSVQIVNPKKSNLAFYHLFSHFGQAGLGTPPGSRTASFAMSKSYSFTDSQGGCCGGHPIYQENSSGFPTLESPTSNECLDAFAKTFPGSSKTLHPAVSRAFRFEMSEDHMAENTRLTGVKSRRHMAHFLCKSNPDELTVSVDAMTLKDDIVKGHQAIIQKTVEVPDTNYIPLKETIEDSGEWDQCL
jgi:hypothetical protein